jgi:hypothetical protein
LQLADEIGDILGLGGAIRVNQGSAALACRCGDKREPRKMNRLCKPTF